MFLSPDYKIVEIADEVLAVPVGEKANVCKDVFTFSTAASMLVKQLNHQTTKQELINRLTKEFDIDDETAKKDIEDFLSSLNSYGLIVQ